MFLFLRKKIIKGSPLTVNDFLEVCTWIKTAFIQYSSNCGGGRWLVGGLCQQPCSHQSTARVGHSRGFFHHFDFMMVDEADETDKHL
jgi:hypothetical protein